MASVVRNLDIFVLFLPPKEDHHLGQGSLAPWPHFQCFSNQTCSLWGESSPGSLFHLAIDPHRGPGPVHTRAHSLQSCPAIWDPMDCTPPGSSVRGILQARILEWHALLQGIFLTQGSNPHLLHLLHWQAGSLPLSTTWEAFFNLYLVIDSILCFQVGDTGREASPTGDPRSTHLESEAGSCVTLVPWTGPGAGWWGDTGAPQKRQWALSSHMGSGNRGTRPVPPPEAWTRKSPLRRSRGWVAAESTPVISQGGRRVISLALNLLLNAARWPCLTEPGRGDRPGTCVRKSNWNAAERNKSGKQMLQLPDALVSPEYECVCWWRGRLVS